MGRTFGDLDDYWSPGLTLTVLGRQYTLPLPSGELGLWCRRVAAVAGEVNAASTEDEVAAAVAAIDDIPELPGKLTLHERVLGDVYQQMLADGVPDPYIVFCGQTAYVWILAGEEQAESFWVSGGRPEAMRPASRQERRAQTRAGKTSTAAAASTRSRASTSGTRSPKKSQPSTTARAPRGQKS